MLLLLFSTDSFFLSYYPHTGNHCTCQSFSVVSDVKSSLVTKGDEWGSYTLPFYVFGGFVVVVGGGFLIMEIVKGFYVISLKNNYKQKGSSTETKRVKGNHTPLLSTW